MDKLTLKELAPYLPYKLRVQGSHWVGDLLGIRHTKKKDGTEIQGAFIQADSYNYEFAIPLHTFKPILRPLPDLTKESGIKDEDLTEFEKTLKDPWKGAVALVQIANASEWTYSDVERMFKRHYDVFGLIKKGLAIDINTIK